MKLSLSQPKDVTQGLSTKKRLVPVSRDRLILEAMAVGIGPALAVYWLCTMALPNKTIFFWLDEPIWVLLCIYATMGFFHEICHLLISPQMGFTKNTVAGFDLKIMCPFVNVTSPMSRNFFIAHGLAPFAILTSLSLGLAFYLSDPFISGWFASIAIANAHACGADILIILHAIAKMSPNDHYQGAHYGPLAQPS